MTVYEYKVTPAPRRLKRVRGVSSTAELFAATLAEAINVAAREGWEYVRAESLPAEESRGWFRRSAEVIETVLIFRRERETLEPRLSGAGYEEGDTPSLGTVERPVERMLRREPRFAEAAEPELGVRRHAPRLGPAETL